MKQKQKQLSNLTKKTHETKITTAPKGKNIRIDLYLRTIGGLEKRHIQSTQHLLLLRKFKSKLVKYNH